MGHPEGAPTLRSEPSSGLGDRLPKTPQARVDCQVGC